MKRRLVMVAAIAAAAAGGAGAAAYLGSGSAEGRAGARTARAIERRDSEVRRIRAHFDSVERELLERDVSALTPAQRKARIRNIRTLHLYRERGDFPQNRDFPDRKIPYFIDAGGRLCAVAHLLATSGRRDIVDRVAARRNNAYVHELADEPGLAAWLDSAGLSLDEAARIQPDYEWNFPPDPTDVAAARARSDRRYLAAAGVTASAGSGALVWNLSSTAPTTRRLRGATGLAAGAAATLLGLSRLDESGAPRAMGALNVAVGLASAGTAIRTLRRAPQSPPPSTATVGAAPIRRAAPSLAFAVSDRSAGLVVNARF